MLRTRPAPRGALAALLAAGLAVAAPAPARADSVTFVLRDLVFSGPSGQNGLPTPVHVSEPGIDGHLVWTYTAGDFAGGTATLLDLLLPITSYPLSSAIVTADASGITGAQPGNVHDLTYDFQLAFAQPLTGPASTSALDTTASTFDFTGGYVLYPGYAVNGEWLGNITGGSIVPESSVLAAPPVAPGPAALAPARPNPFRDATAIECVLGAPGRAELAVFGVDGRRVATLLRGVQPAGRVRVTWDGRDDAGRAAPPALYYVRLVTPQGALARRVVRLR